jgi:hypothetical protein
LVRATSVPYLLHLNRQGGFVSLISLFCKVCGGDVYQRDHAYTCRPIEDHQMTTPPPEVTLTRADIIEVLLLAKRREPKYITLSLDTVEAILALLRTPSVEPAQGMTGEEREACEAGANILERRADYENTKWRIVWNARAKVLRALVARLGERKP